MYVLSFSVMSLCDPMNYSPPDSVHGDSSGKNTGMGCHTLLQGIFPTQELNPGLLHSRQILYHLKHKGKKEAIKRAAMHVSLSLQENPLLIPESLIQNVFSCLSEDCSKEL